jgi:hypothetical protein
MVCSLVGEIERGEILAKMTKTRVNREERKITYKEDDIWLDNPQFLPPLLLALSTRRYFERTIIDSFQFHLSHQFHHFTSQCTGNVHHHQDSSLVCSQSVQTHHSFPAILDSIYLTEFDNRPYAAHGGGRDNGLGLEYRVILESLI